MPVDTEECSPVAFVAINALSVPPEMAETLESRFAARAGEVEKMDGFLSFDLLRPKTGQDKYLVVTRWESESAFQSWLDSQAFAKGHAQSSERPAASGSDVWTFDIVLSVDKA